MIEAVNSDKEFIVNLLTECFEDNKSVNYIIAKDNKKQQRIKGLMDYSFEMCSRFGDVFLNEDRSACALILYPDKKKISLKTIGLDIKLILRCIGFKNIKKVLNREKEINKGYPNKNIFYLWYIAVNKTEQSKGIGSVFLQKICKYAESCNRDMYLETSAQQNIRWYKKMGFQLYKELNFGYTLNCFRRKRKIGNL